MQRGGSKMWRTHFFVKSLNIKEFFPYSNTFYKHVKRWLINNYDWYSSQMNENIILAFLELHICSQHIAWKFLTRFKAIQTVAIWTVRHGKIQGCSLVFFKNWMPLYFTMSSKTNRRSWTNSYVHSIEAPDSKTFQILSYSPYITLTF